MRAWQIASLKRRPLAGLSVSRAIAKKDDETPVTS